MCLFDIYWKSMKLYRRDDKELEEVVKTSKSCSNYLEI